MRALRVSGFSHAIPIFQKKTEVVRILGDRVEHQRRSLLSNVQNLRPLSAKFYLGTQIYFVFYSALA